MHRQEGCPHGAITLYICIATKRLPRWGINTRCNTTTGQSLFISVLLQAIAPMGHQHTIAMHQMAIIDISLAFT